LAGSLGVGDGGERLFGDVLADLGVALEFLRDRAQQRLDRRLVARHSVSGTRAPRRRRRWAEFVDAHPGLALDQHLYRAVGQLEQLQHAGQHAGLVDALGCRVVLGGVDLAGKQDLRSSCITSSSARTDFSRPTKSGTIM
jgi:hypothetical protein